MIKKIYLLCFVFTSFLIEAQKPVLVHLSEKDGLPDKEFYGIIEDDKGFIWLYADKGLFRYDGKNFKKYDHKKQRGLSVFNAQKDSLGRIWCNNISGQFFYIQEDRLHLFIDLKEQLKGKLTDFVVKKNNLLIFSDENYFTVNLKNKKIVKQNGSKRKFGVPFQYKNNIYIESKGFIYKVTSSNKLKEVAKTSLTLEHKNKRKFIEGKSKIFVLNNQLFIRQKIKGINNFFQFFITKKRANSLIDLKKLQKELIYYEFENDNKLWITTKSGVWVYEYKNNTFKLINKFLEGKHVTKIIQDKDNNYWCATLNEGIYIIPNVYIESAIISEENKNISSLDKANDSTLILGMTNGNLAFYNTNKNTNTVINLPTKYRVATLKYNPNENTTFISKDDYGYVLDNNTLKISKVDYFQTVKSISILDNNDVLHTNYNKAIIVKSGNFNKKEKVISKGKRTYASYFDKIKKEVYISFVDNLVVYDSVWKPKIISYKNQPIYGKSISQTFNGIVWVATFKEGVFGIKNNKVIYHFTTKNGLTSNYIEKIKADQNKLWIALDNSIQMLDVISQKIKTLTKRDGIVSYDISGIEIIADKVYFSSSAGLFSINKQKSFKNQNPEVYFNTVQINEKDTAIVSNYELAYNQNSIKIGFHVNGFLFNQKGKYNYRLKGFNNNWITTSTDKNSVKYNSLPTGNYTFQVAPIIDNKKTLKTNKIKEITFVINKPFWKTWWFIFCVVGTLVAGIIIYFRIQIKHKEKERIAQLEKISLEKELIAINLTALRSQMNPHFIFNALNSIQDLVLKQDTDATYDSIVLFSKLIRNVLNYSNQDFISIQKELDFLKVYLQLEKLRFGDDFNYIITCNATDNLEIPSLLIQPFIENAIIHGLLHKTGSKKLIIEFLFTNNILQCSIIDNGVGRLKASEIGNRQGNHHKSFALSSIEKRLEIFKKQYNNAGYQIEDLYNENTPAGTKVIVTMPFIKKF